MASTSASKPVSAYLAYQSMKEQKQFKDAHKESQCANAQQKKLKKKGTPCSAPNSKKLKLQESSSHTAEKIAAASNGSTGSSNKRKAKRRKNQKQKQKLSVQKLAAAVDKKETDDEVAAISPSSDDSASVADSNDEHDDSVIDPVVEATEVFKEIIAPMDTDQFFGAYWERKPLLVKRNSPDHYGDWFSTEDFDWLLRTHRVMFGEHLDVTSYRDGKRETHNPEGRALASQVWQFYQSGCSLRLLCPQVFHERVYQKLSILHELFGSFVGANIYLTPPGTQGFAPHWDDIEAFVMQLEGRKHWRVYAPRHPAERLPRESSGNFGPKDRLGQPVIDTVLEPGDLLYMPRGYIHQGRCLDKHHSLHITVSTYQKFAWADLLAEALSGALDRAAREDVEFRRGLPLGLLGFAGDAFASAPAGDGGDGDERATRRRQADELCRSLLARLAAHVSLDEAADRLGCQQVRDALPPALDPSEAVRSAYGVGPGWDTRRCRVVTGGGSGLRRPLTGASRVRLVRRSAARLNRREGRLYSSLGNTRVFREAEPAYLEVEPALAPGVSALAAAYPHFLAVDQLPLADPEERLALAAGLYERGLLVAQDLP